MKIYFAVPVIVEKSPSVPYRDIKEFLQKRGHQILTEHLLEPEVWESESKLPREFVYERDTSWIESSDVLIAEVSIPSTGIGYEIGYALSLKKKVLCLAREGVKVSAMIEGNKNLTFFRYRDPQEALGALEDFLEMAEERI
ncbi:MAG: nucleoside 2-deoxyribosyltransferase [Caldiserica bacterium]|jgi:nucleoside 2-deoxyribosyltransferase|nr:nucleoside 2-deoxyribosyltransferase [Caldisericota bacterium]MDH7561780.1 nucleoside 2-deoxyribosyltransferase [Caldisericota bacterium]